MTAQAVQGASTYLTFTLGEETFAVDVANVREVLDLVQVTRVPRTPHFMKGIINLRGSVVPVVDMRVKLGLPATDTTPSSCIIVAEVCLDGETSVIGALADSVKEVFEMRDEEIEPPPAIGMRGGGRFVKGMGRREERFIIVLDADQVFTADERTDGPPA